MKLLKYFINSLIACFDAMVGKGNGNFKEGIPGLIGLALIVGLFFIFLFIIDKKTNYEHTKVIAISLLLTLGTITLFFGLSHIVEIIFKL